MQLKLQLKSDHYRQIDFRIWNVCKGSGFNFNRVMLDIRQYMNKSMTFDGPLGLAMCPHDHLNHHGGLFVEVISWYEDTYHNPLGLELMAKHSVYSSLCCGVYFLWCGGPSIYIGQTERPFRYRWEEHERDLESGNHHCDKLQQCFDDYQRMYFLPMIALSKSIDRVTTLDRDEILKYELWAIDNIQMKHNTL